MNVFVVSTPNAGIRKKEKYANNNSKWILRNLFVGLKTGVENAIFWYQIGSGFGEPGGTPSPTIPWRTPPPPIPPHSSRKVFDVGSPVLGSTNKGNLKNRMSLTLRNLD